EKPERRWRNPKNMHQLYCAGHMFEAAVAHYRITGKRKFLDVALRFADLIDSVFGPGKMLDPPGHQEIEMGLVKLHRATGKKKYLDLARFFLDQRGNPNRGRVGGWYHQDHVPLVEQTEAVGHAVRAVYGYCGMADVAMLTGDKQYVSALDRFWENVVSRKMSLTGGIGGGLWEAFDRAYFLPNTSCYNETCGAMANTFWNHRMFLLHGGAKYLDVLERTLYNGALGGISLAGDGFFYPNRLESRGGKRQPWFKCACCPSNAARFFSSVGKYLYATRGETLMVNLYAHSSAEVTLGGRAVAVRQETDYPWSGKVRLHIDPAGPASFPVALRIPGWARNRPVPGGLYHYRDTDDGLPALKVNSKTVKLELEDGFAVIRRSWKNGDVIELDLPMPVRRVLSNAALLDNAGLVALERGPLVYCVEGVDVGKTTGALNLRITPDAELRTEHRKDLLGGVTVITGHAMEISRGPDKVSVVEKRIPLVAIPYYARSNREVTSMVVWMLDDSARAILPAVPTIASTSRVTASVPKGNFGALSDQVAPVRSGDASRGVFQWRKRGTTEWVQYDFKKAEEVSAVEVYWYARFGTAVKLPQSWRLLYRVGDEFKPVENGGPYGVEPDRFNRVTFTPVRTDALRIEAKLQDKYLETYLAKKDERPSKMSAGILEWRVE
ncbi:MAG: glycoside hydrolase family 127 protein, partial [Planctomycetota bacterium]